MLLNSITFTLLALVIVIPARAGSAEDKALRDAAGVLDVEGAKTALKNGASANAPDGKMTALGNVALANLLGVSNPSLEQKNAGFMDRETVHSNAVVIAKMLFIAGARIGPYDGEILYAPIVRGNVKLVELLIERGAPVNGDLEGYTPTHLLKKPVKRPSTSCWSLTALFRSIGNHQHG
jgi:hypothetical protein